METHRIRITSPPSIRAGTRPCRTPGNAPCSCRPRSADLQWPRSGKHYPRNAAMNTDATSFSAAAVAVPRIASRKTCCSGANSYPHRTAGPQALRSERILLHPSGTRTADGAAEAPSGQGTERARGGEGSSSPAIPDRLNGHGRARTTSKRGGVAGWHHVTISPDMLEK